MARHKGALARARQLREEFRARGEFNTKDYREELRDALAGFAQDAFQGFVEGVAEQIDKESAREEPQQGLLFPGETWDIGGEYHLNGGRRIAKTLARLEHLEEVIANDERNIALVLEASARKHDELRQLRPYLRPGRSKIEAIRAYRDDHPAA